ncbi:unnamed protein product, partial [Meganyctiphanes norvegica]
GMRPLHWACLEGNKEGAAAALLLRKGCQRDPRDSLGDTPLHLAVQHGELQVAMLLASKGHPLLVHNNAGETPLDQAQEFGQTYNWLIKRQEYTHLNFSHKPVQVVVQTV